MALLVKKDFDSQGRCAISAIYKIPNTLWVRRLVEGGNRPQSPLPFSTFTEPTED